MKHPLPAAMLAPLPTQVQLQAQKSTLPCRPAVLDCDRGRPAQIPTVSLTAAQLNSCPAYLQPACLSDRLPARVHKSVSSPVSCRLPDTHLTCRQLPAHSTQPAGHSRAPWAGCAIRALPSPAISSRAGHGQHGLRAAASWGLRDQMLRWASTSGAVAAAVIPG